MKQPICTKATLGRLPLYLDFLRSVEETENISAAEIARSLRLGEVQVRKDLNAVCGFGRPKTGYRTVNLINRLESILNRNDPVPVVLTGVGKLGSALYGFSGFEVYGIRITAAFDKAAELIGGNVYPMEQFTQFCVTHDIHAGIIAVPVDSAQETCDLMVQSGITAIWNFAPCQLTVPDGVTVLSENLALSLAHLTLSVRNISNDPEG